MGASCGTARTAEEKAAAAASRQIDLEMAKAKKQMLHEILLLLLGTGASGKSTVAKQMQILYLNGFGDQELEVYKQLIVTNIVNNMKALINGANQLGITISLSQEAETVMAIEDSEDETDWTPALCDAIKALWADAGIQAAFSRSNEFQLSDSAQYFFERLENFRDLRKMVVTDGDILHTRKRTTGVVEITFANDDFTFRMMDVGGQRNERRKWIHCFDNVTSIIFVASLSEYDQTVEEDNKTNRMVESLHVFGEAVNNEYFAKTPIILFLNKNDIFEQKIKEKDLGDYFPAYKGGKNADAARKWIEKQYRAKNENPQREIFVHVTTATDTSNISTVFDAVKNILLSNVLESF
jgi:guanine nucleotide-binding protein G(o) subunit alpha